MRNQSVYLYSVALDGQFYIDMAKGEESLSWVAT